MSRWEHEASRRWRDAWIGGAGPFACVVTYIKGTGVTLFKNASEAAAHKGRLDALQPQTKRWRSTQIVNLLEAREQRTKATTHGRR